MVLTGHPFRQPSLSGPGALRGFGWQAIWWRRIVVRAHAVSHSLYIER
jgi:hypothetical protein